MLNKVFWSKSYLYLPIFNQKTYQHTIISQKGIFVNMKKSVYNITPEGKLALEQELKELIADRPNIAERIATARAFGDLKENEEYSNARSEQKIAETRILDIEDILKNAKIIEKPTSDKVIIGSVVTIEGNGKQITYSVVGPVEADPLNGKISDKSPIGQALLGKKIGDIATISTPKATTNYTIISIN